MFGERTHGADAGSFSGDTRSSFTGSCDTRSSIGDTISSDTGSSDTGSSDTGSSAVERRLSCSGRDVRLHCH